METLFPVAVFIVGILVMFRVISVRRSGKYLMLIGLAFLFGPVIYGIARTNAAGLFSQRHPWWVYLIAFFVVLIVLRGILNFLFPGRRR